MEVSLIMRERLPVEEFEGDQETAEDKEIGESIQRKRRNLL